MQGFKSFAKKADLTFNNSITVVVGPNGSGKSNIVDAVRWVLGEGSAKSLRGSKMEDVIFSGSIDKKPLGMAQVSLTLDNSSGIFPVDYSEIKITRKLFRSGESEYLINNVRCRQKDIHELIMDTGIGKDSFAIIGQGKVDQILLSQADEKRALIEEVAGISKYRYRKNEAKRKLLDTETSLLRVKDILRELEIQKDPLKEQAEKALEYKSYKSQLDELEINLASFMIGSLEEKSKIIKEETESLTKENITRETLNLKNEAQIEEISLTLEKTIREISEIQNNIYQVNNNTNDLENKKEYSDKLIITLNDNYKKLEEEEKKINSELQELILKKEEEELSYQVILNEYQMISADFKKEEETIQNIKNSESGVNQKIQEIKGELFDFAYQISDTRNKIIDLEKREAVINSGKDGIESKIIKNKDFKLHKNQEKAEVNKDLASAISDWENIEKQIRLLEKEKDQVYEKAKEKESIIRKKNEEREKKLINKNALESLENKKEGYSAGVKSIFSNKNLKGIIGTVADLAETSSEYSLAVEIALGGAIQNIVMENEIDAKNAIDFLRENKSGRATFLPLNIINQRVKNRKEDTKGGNLKTALEVIKYDERYAGIFKQLLGGIYIAKDIDEALKYNKEQGRPVKIVTLKGEVIDPRGSMTGGQYRNNQEGFFLRKDKIKALRQEIIQIEEEKAGEEGDLLSLNSQIRVTESKIKELDENKLIIEKKKQNINNLLIQIDFQISEADKEILLLNSEEINLREEKEGLSKEKKTILESFAQLEIGKKDKESLMQKLQEDMEFEKNSLFDLEKALSKMEINYNNLKNKKENKENLLDELKIRKNLLVKKIEETFKEKEEIEKRIKDLKDNEIEYKNRIKELEMSHYDFQKKAEELKEIKEEGEKTKKALEEDVKKNRKVYEAIKDSIHSKELTLEKYRTESQNLKETLEERFDILYQSITSQYLEDFSERGSKQKIREYRKKIEDLGEINLIAISEYEKLLERYTFLNAQCSDLDGAKDALMKIIDEMDHIISKKFIETYDKLNIAFQETFTEMFRGGMAEIVMTDKNNILETGIEIIAQPPGKTPKHLSLLSGGEKAMTAICLLFAILKIKPGPFCILDEIEASLDESNVTRFAGFLKNFAQFTQFIVISHRKGTMEAGDVLYGVTMKDKGVSSLISVRISETIKLTS